MTQNGRWAKTMFELASEELGDDEQAHILMWTVTRALEREFLDKLLDPSADIREQATWMLVQLGPSQEAAPDLFSRLDDPSPKVVRWAVAAQITLIEPLALPLLRRHLVHDSAAVRIEATRALLAARDEKSIEALISSAKNDKNEAVRVAAVVALGGFSSDLVFAALESLSRDPVTLVRAEALWSLRTLADPRALDLFIARLDDPEPEVSIKAAAGLGTVLDAKAVPPLIAVLDRDRRDRFLWANAIKALGKLKDTRALDPIAAHASSDDPELFTYVAWALGNIGDPSVVDALIPALDAPDAGSRTCAANALAKLPTQASKDALRARLAKEINGPVRAAITEALRGG